MTAREVVRRLGGKITDVPLTFSLSQQRPVNVEGSSGLRLRLGVDASDLVSDLRAIAEVCRRPQPHPDLALVENIQPTTIRTMIYRLDAQWRPFSGRAP